MLTLADASAYFDRTPIQDPDNGRVLFQGQVEPFDDSKRDSTGAYRRILSVAPGTRLPPLGAVKILGQVWTLGAREVDGMEEAHREKYVLQAAPLKFKVSRLANFLTATADSSVWGYVDWVRDGKELEVSSRAVSMHTAYFHASADVREYDIVWYDTRAYLVFSSHIKASGFLEVICSPLENAPGDATLRARVYDPVLGRYTGAVASSVRTLQLRWQSLYQYGSQADARFQEGDATLVLPAGTQIGTTDTLELDGVSWGVLSSENLAGAVVVHGRPR